MKTISRRGRRLGSRLDDGADASAMGKAGDLLHGDRFDIRSIWDQTPVMAEGQAEMIQRSRHVRAGKKGAVQLGAHKLPISSLRWMECADLTCADEQG